MHSIQIISVNGCFIPNQVVSVNIVSDTWGPDIPHTGYSPKYPCLSITDWCQWGAHWYHWHGTWGIRYMRYQILVSVRCSLIPRSVQLLTVDVTSRHLMSVRDAHWYGTLHKVHEALMCLRQCSLILPDLVWETAHWQQLNGVLNEHYLKRQNLINL